MSSETAASQPGQDSEQQTAPKADPRQVLQHLQQHYDVFRDCKPLALRIDKEVMAALPQFSHKLVRAAMHIHTSSTRYLKAVARGTARYNLDGSEHSPLDEAHREYANETLQKRFAESAKRKKEQQKQQEAEQRREQKLQQLKERFSSH